MIGVTMEARKSRDVSDICLSIRSVCWSPSWSPARALTTVPPHPDSWHRSLRHDFPRLSVIFGDNKYRNHALNAWLKSNRPEWRVEVKMRAEGTKGFTPLEKRWVIERTNAWNGRCRRNSKDYERRTESSTAMIQISNVHLMLRKLAAQHQPAFHYRAAA